jgi:hypothetical protein
VVAPVDVLGSLAAGLRAEDSVISPQVREPAADASPALGLLAAAGPRAGANEGDYALVVESVREGYLLHYARPRLLADLDSDLALLAGDYLYALGLERLTALGDVEAVRELSDLISLSAQLHAEARSADGAAALWLGSVVAIACGPEGAHDEAKRALRADAPDAPDRLLAAARATAAEAGIADGLERAAEAIDFGSSRG